LIHIEQCWNENLLTAEGKIMHERAHDASISEKRGDVIILHDLRIKSSVLGVSGACDVVEFHQSDDGIPLHGWDGKWLPYPVEYKRGKSKEIDADRLQLCGQAMCLEEMLCCEVKEGALYYGETRHREKVLFNADLRNEVVEMLKEMHDYYKRGYTPKPKKCSGCKSCSLKDICLPEMNKIKSVRRYINDSIEGDEE